MTDHSIYMIVALLPLAAMVLVSQQNPYHALVLRGILGAVSALVYAVLGAADVALTEALVGTLLSITLYAVAVRSSLVMRLGVVKDRLAVEDKPFEELIADLRVVLGKHYLRLELVPYLDTEALHQALAAKEVHATCVCPADDGESETLAYEKGLPYQTTVRVQRLYEILQTELLPDLTSLAYVQGNDVKQPYHTTANSMEAH
ncbi:MAG TPA: DUF4040 domain-containing protein [Leptolyngbyaceae cyanobacterium]